MDAPGHPADVKRHANDLYWGSDASVNQIAAELDLSKSALYGLLEPLPAGSSCPACGEDTGYANRTARQRDRLACTVCGWEGAENETSTGTRSRLDARGGEEIGGNGGAPAAAARPTPFQEQTARPLNRMLIGGALLGAAAGIALVAFARRER